MTTKRQLRANCANAKASTGPKSATGKARAAVNALRHGLNIPVYLDPVLALELEALAQRIAGESADPLLVDLARPIAETQIDLRRIRAHKLRRIASSFVDPSYQPQLSREPMRPTGKVSKNDDLIVAGVLQIQRSVEFKSPEQKLMSALDEFAHEFEKLDRYERRILSRRKFAIRAFDAHRALSARR